VKCCVVCGRYSKGKLAVLEHLINGVLLVLCDQCASDSFRIAEAIKRAETRS